LAEARRLQSTLRAGVLVEDRLGPVRHAAGLDAHYGEAHVWGAAVLMGIPDMAVLESALARRRLSFPYVPGLLSFREAPALLAALQHLATRPDLLLVDGHGVSHPRRFGLACHIGILADVPTIGVAKSRLVGTYEEPGVERGAWSPLVDRGETVGAVVRTRRAVRPVFVSVGHRVCLATAIDLALRCSGRFRLPEPIRAADRLSRGHRSR
jgi:deoxyribonuclease V